MTKRRSAVPLSHGGLRCFTGQPAVGQSVSGLHRRAVPLPHGGLRCVHFTSETTL